MSLSSSCATRRCVPGNAERPIESLSVASQMWVFWSSGFTPVQSIPRTQASTGHVPEYCFLFPQPLAPTPSPLTPSLSLSLHPSVPLSIAPTASPCRVCLCVPCVLPSFFLSVLRSLARRLVSAVLRAVVRMCIQGPLESDELRAAKNKLLQVLASVWWA